MINLWVSALGSHDIVKASRAIRGYLPCCISTVDVEYFVPVLVTPGPLHKAAPVRYGRVPIG
jgi:hypothetical protein